MQAKQKEIIPIGTTTGEKFIRMNSMCISEQEVEDDNKDNSVLDENDHRDQIN